MRSVPLARGFLLLLLVLTTPAWGQPITQGDPLELARTADRLGERALLEAIEQGDVQALRAAGFARSPERVLSRLGEIAAGDDPRRAPAAAHAGHRLALRLDPRELDAREADREMLRTAVAPWTGLMEDETARADLRSLAGVVVASITEVLAER